MNVQLVRIILALVILVVITSCAVGPQGTYYKPLSSNSSAISEGGWAYGSAGPPAVIKLTLEDGVLVKVRLDPAKDGKTRLRLFVDIPQGSSAQFSAEGIKLTDPSSGKEWVIRPETIKLLQPPIGVSAIDTINLDELGPTTHL